MPEVAIAAEFLPGQNVSLHALRHICQDANVEVETGMDDDLLVTSGRLAVLLSLCPSQSVRFSAPFVIDTEVSTEVLHAAANGFNQRSRVAKAHVQPDKEFGHRVFFESDLNFEGGLHPDNLVMRLRRFEEDVRGAEDLLHFGIPS